MTATIVNGLAVIADEATQGPIIPNSNGKRVQWTQTRSLLLEDGTELYGCKHCDYTSTNMLSIRPHLNKHRVRKHAPQSNGSAPDRTADKALAQALRQLGDMQELRKAHDSWRLRAITAENRLRRVRECLAEER